MKILAFDTATRATAVALIALDRDGATLAAHEARDDPPAGARPRHTTRLMTLIVDALERSGSAWEDVQRLAVGVGPGTFTGLRIGVATARALARAREIPLVGVSTLESLAFGAASADPEHEVVLAVADARRSEVFVAAWSARELAAGVRTPLLAPRAMGPAQLAQASARLGGARLMVGDGAVEFRQVLERSGTWIPEDDSPLHRVSAVTHGRLAGSEIPGPPGTVKPQYLRAPDAELALRGAGSQ